MAVERTDVPRVVRTNPPAFATDVDPRTSEVVVTFDRPMIDQSWSFWPLARSGEMFPQLTGQARYDRSRRTFILPVKLAAGQVYWVWLNSPIHRYFMTDDYRRAAPRVLLFATSGRGGRPTPIPPALLAQAREINARPAPPAEPELFAAKRLPIPPAPATVSPTWPPRGEPVRIPVTRDAWLRKGGAERVGNRRGQKRLKLKGQQDCVLFDADLAPLRGKVIAGCLWHVYCGSPDAPLLRVGVSTVATPWGELSDWSNHRAPGQACWEQAAFGERDWAYPGSSVMDAAFGRGHTLWRFADASPPDAAGWQTVAIDPAVVAANAAGLSHGFAACDEVGSEWRDTPDGFEFVYFPNRMIHSAQDRRFAPYLEVWTDGAADRPPETVGVPVTVETADLPAGEAIVTLTTPRDAGRSGTLGFLVHYRASSGRWKPVPRYLVPLAGGPGHRARMHLQDLGFKPGQRVRLRIAAVDAAGNVGPEVETELRVAGARPVRLAACPLRPFPASGERPTVGGVSVAVVDLLDKVRPDTGEMVPPQPPRYKAANHLWSARQRRVRLQAARNEAVCFNVNLEGGAPAEVKLGFPDQSRLRAKLFRYHYTSTPAGLMPDACLPLAGPVAPPPGCGNVTVLCEVYVPHDAGAGLRRGQLTISAGGQTLTLAVELTVWDFTLPDKLSFVPEMNAYFKVTPAGRGLDYYRLAHEHRTCINRLYYSWDGVPDCRPEWRGDRFAWGRWDKLFGPLFDGSAFADLPRAGEPVDFFYLPTSDNWPVNIFDHYRPSYWPEDAFDDAYRAGLHRATVDMARHFDGRGWHDTAFQFFLNSKVYYKREVGFRGSSAPWIFDEPVDTKDFWALRWYGEVFRRAVAEAGGRAKLWYRGDVSYSEHERDMLWGVMDLECFGGVDEHKVRQKRDEQRLCWDALHTQYGAANHPSEPNLQPVIWCLRAFCQGAVGVLPWHSIAGEGALDQAGQTDLFYDHPARGVVPSVRLKAFRAGQQLVEYLTLLASVKDQPLWAVASAVRETINLGGRIHKTSETDAGTLRVEAVDPAALWQLRCRVGQMLSAAAPPCRRVVRPMATPVMPPERAPELGYARVAPPVELAPPARPVCRFGPVSPRRGPVKPSL